jgi:hypothetical protein
MGWLTLSSMFRWHGVNALHQPDIAHPFGKL